MFDPRIALVQVREKYAAAKVNMPEVLGLKEHKLLPQAGEKSGLRTVKLPPTLKNGRRGAARTTTMPEVLGLKERKLLPQAGE